MDILEQKLSQGYTRNMRIDFTTEWTLYPQAKVIEYGEYEVCGQQIR